jgi:ferritin
MMQQRMQDAINEQINWELYSSYLYLSMSTYFESINLKGFSNWMRVQAMEELTHFKRFYDFLTARGGRVVLSEIKAPPREWGSPLEAFEEVLRHEEGVTERINRLVDLAGELRDHATASFLRWFVDEQVEEEASVEGIIQGLRLNKDNPSGLFMIDRELSQRTFLPPVDVKV